MKLTDRFVIKDKASEKAIRDLDCELEKIAASSTLNKTAFMESHYLMLELLVTVFKRLDDNSSPARSLLDFSRDELKDACMRVGPSQVFTSDVDYVTGVLKELTKR